MSGRERWLVVAGSVLATGVVVFAGLVFFSAGEPRTWPTTLLRETAPVGTLGVPGNCVLFGPTVYCDRYDLAIPGTTGEVHAVVLRVAVNQSCTDSCIIELSPTSPSTDYPGTYVSNPNLTASSSTLLPSGPAFVLIRQGWGCGLGSPCPNPPIPLTFSVTVLDMGTVPS